MTKQHWAANPRAQPLSGLEPWSFQSCYVGETPIKTINKRGVAKMAEQKDPEITSFHGHTTITTIYRAILMRKS